MAKSQNGWLVPTSKHLVSWKLEGGTKLYMRDGSAGFLLAHLATRFDRKVQNLEGRILDDWAYAYRPVRGYSVLSNHASGTAIDLNATQHPLGKRGTFTDAQHKQIDNILSRYDGCIRWGGHYSGRLDAMHFEINKPIGACEKVARELMNSPVGALVLSQNPAQRRVILS